MSLKRIMRLKRTVSSVLVGALLISQIALPLLAVQNAYAAQGAVIAAADHEGQLKPTGTYTNGNVIAYQELDRINFRFTLTANDSASGQMQVRYDREQTGQCLFFQSALNLGTHDGSADPVTSISGGLPVVTTFGPPTIEGSEWVQLLDVSFTSAGEATVNYYLQLTDDAANCSGSATHVELGNSATPGDFAHIGTQSVPVPAKDIAPAPIYDGPKGTITVIKQVINNDGGTAVGSDFDLKINDQVVAQGAPHSYAAGETYEISEDMHTDGYRQTGVTCKDADHVSTEHPFVLEAGAEIICAVTNDDLPAYVTLTKEVVNDDGGTANASDFTLMLNGGVVAQNDRMRLPANTVYAATEAPHSGYVLSQLTCSDQNGPIAGNGSFMLQLGQDVTCTFTNDDVGTPQLPVVDTEEPAKGHIKIKKYIINDNGGQATTENFEYLANGVKMIEGEYREFESGHYFTLTENYGLPGYKLTSIRCYDAYSEAEIGHPFILRADQWVVCRMINNDLPPTISVYKQVINNNGGTKTAEDFALSINGEHVEQNAIYDIKVGESYMVGEQQQKGYYHLDTHCVDLNNGEHLAHPVIARHGQRIQCGVWNDDIGPKVFIEKVTVPGEHDQNFEFRLYNHDRSAAFTLDTKESDRWHYNEYNVDNLKAGKVTIGELPVDGWSSEYIVCYPVQNYFEGAVPTGSAFVFAEDVSEVSFDVEVGDLIRCVFVNVQHGNVLVTKFNDTDEDGFMDADEVALSGWEMQLRELVRKDLVRPIEDVAQNGMGFYSEGVTDEDGTALLGGPAVPGSVYGLREVLQDGWRQTNVYCDVNPRDDDQFDSKQYELATDEHFVGVLPGETTHCYVGNVRNESGGGDNGGGNSDSEAVLLLEKSNSTSTPLATGSTVTYTLTITNPENSEMLKDVTVTDTPPEGFTYTPGSWTAQSTERGDLKALNMTPEPTYGSPGTWLLGTMNPGETVTLTYQTLIQKSVSDGIYPDIAYALGVTGAGVPVFDNIHLASVADPFVSTQVAVVGEAGVVLAHTGVRAILPAVIGLMVMTAAVLTGSGGRMRRRLLKLLARASTSFAALSLVIMLFSGAAMAQARFWTVNISTPADTTSGNFNIDYQVASTVTSDTFSIDLIQNDVVVDSQQVVRGGGNSGRFTVMLAEQGVYTYAIQVTNVADETTKTSDAITVRYGNAPQGAVILSKTRSGSNYTIRFLVPTGSSAQQVKIYASTATSFIANEDTLVGTLTVTPGREQTFVYAAPDEQARYFAVQTIDENGNTSTTGETVVDVTDENDAGQVAGETIDGDVSDASGAPSNNAADDASDQNDEAGGNEDQSSSRNVVVAAIIGGVAVYLYVRYRRNVQSDES